MSSPSFTIISISRTHQLNMNVFIGVEGFTLPAGFIAKEICILFPNREFCHYIFKAPINPNLSAADHRTIRFTTDKLNKLSWYDGFISYETIPEIMIEFQQFRIFTYGEVVMRFIQKLLPLSVVTNTQTDGYAMPSVLPNPACCRDHPPRYCAKAKAVAIGEFVESLD